MHRRSFLSALAALVAAPALPGVTPSVAAAHFRNASIIARAHNRCSVEMLARNLRVTPDVAARIQAQLVRRGVISAPIAGTSLAVHPTNSHCITNEALRPNNLIQRALDMKERLDRLLEETPPDPDTPDQA